MTARHLAAGIASGVLLLVPATSVLAQQPIGTSFEVQANTAGLTMAWTTTSTRSLSNVTFSGSPQSVTGAFDSVTITDDRGDLVNDWAFTVVATDWSAGGATDVSASDAIVYIPVANVGSVVGTSMTFTDCVCAATSVDASALVGGTDDLAVGYELLTGVAATLPAVLTSEVTVTPNLYVDVPANLPVGTYTNTVTFDLS